MNTRFGVDQGRATKLANLLIAEGRIGEAYAALDAARSKVAAGDAQFWRLFGRLAILVQQEQAARQSYANTSSI